MEEVLKIIYEFLFAAPEGVTMALGPLAVAGIASAGIQAVGGIISGIFGAGRARRARRAAEAEKRRLTGELKSLENGRQKVINPYIIFKTSSIIFSSFLCVKLKRLKFYG